MHLYAAWLARRIPTSSASGIIPDSAASKSIMKLLKDLHKKGHTIVMVTHDPDIAAYANRVVHTLDGKIDSDTKGIDAPKPKKTDTKPKKRKKRATKKKSKKKPTKAKRATKKKAAEISEAIEATEGSVEDSSTETTGGEQ